MRLSLTMILTTLVHLLSNRPAGPTTSNCLEDYLCSVASILSASELSTTLPVSTSSIGFPVGLVEGWVIWNQIILCRKSPPTCDPPLASSQGIAAFRILFAMGVHGIFATKVLSVAGAGTGLIRTQEAMYTSEMAIPVSLDLLRVRVPVQTGPHSAEESFAVEVGNRRGRFAGVRSH